MVRTEKSVILGGMHVWSPLLNSQYLFQNEFQGGVVTIGNFDGLHLGHQTLLEAARNYPNPRIVMTFDPHPMQILQPERQLRRIFPREDVAEQLPNYGVDLLIVLSFDRDFAKIPALEFLNHYIWEALKPKHLVAGYDFAFGSGRTGTLDVLKAWGSERHITVDVTPPKRLGGEVVSSRRIRDLVIRGDVHGAHLLLGRPFYLRGKVVAGVGRGSTIGIPTLNQLVENETLPPRGVYASRVRCDQSEYDSVTNIGFNPTFESEQTLKIETHILDGEHNLRDCSIDVQFFERLRDEKKFANVSELKNQIESDIRKARAILQGETK